MEKLLNEQHTWDNDDLCHMSVSWSEMMRFWKHWEWWIKQLVLPTGSWFVYPLICSKHNTSSFLLSDYWKQLIPFITLLCVQPSSSTHPSCILHKCYIQMPIDSTSSVSPHLPFTTTTLPLRKCLDTSMFCRRDIFSHFLLFLRR